jgi:hypothetical protein
MLAKKIESIMCHALRVPLEILGDPPSLTCPPPPGYCEDHLVTLFCVTGLRRLRAHQ